MTVPKETRATQGLPARVDLVPAQPDPPGLAALQRFRERAQAEALVGVDEDGDPIELPTDQAFDAAEDFLRKVPIREPVFLWIGNPRFDLFLTAVDEQGDKTSVTVRFHEDGTVLIARSPSEKYGDIVDAADVDGSEELRAMFESWT